MSIIMRSCKFYCILVIGGSFLLPHLKAVDSAKPDRKYVKEIKQLADHPKIKQAFKRIVELESTTHDNLVYLTEIPAPPFKESDRAKAFADLLKNAGADEVFIDGAGNILSGTAQPRLGIRSSNGDFEGQTINLTQTGNEWQMYSFRVFHHGEFGL